MATYYNEFEPYAAAWLRNLIAAGHLPAGDVDQRSITEVSPDDLKSYRQAHFFAGIGGWPLALRMAGWDDERPVWTGSCPCQPFSVAGQRKGESDPRHLWPQFRRLIAERSPPVVFGEQVASKAGRNWFSNVRLDLEALDYAVGCADICASAIQKRQHRERLFFVASAPSAVPARRVEAVWRIGGDEQMEKDWQHAEWRESCEVGVLDDGIPSRLAKAITKGLGNAIVPQVAAEFIGAYDDIAA